MKLPSKHIVIAALLVLSISLSGCLENGGTASTVTDIGYPGVSIVEFYPVTPEIYAGSTANLYLRVQNTGFFDASNVEIILYNCGNIKDGTVSLDTGDEDYSCNDEIALLGENELLEKPKRDIDVVGESKQAQFALETPDFFPEGRSTHTFGARVLYDYTTTARRDVVFTTFDNWQEKGGVIEAGLLNSFSDPSPVQVSIQAPSDAIILTETNPDQRFTISVGLNNVGGGSVPEKAIDSLMLCYPGDFLDVSNHKDFEAEPVKNLKFEVEVHSSIAATIMSNIEVGLPSDIYYVYKESQSVDASGVMTITYGVPESYAQDFKNIVNGASGNQAKITLLTAVSDTKCLTAPSEKLRLLGLTNQYLNLDAEFKVKQGTIKIQDVVTFTAAATYPYSLDSSTSLTLIG